MGVVVDVTHDRISFARGEESLGNWPLGDVDVELRADGFHLRFEEEEILLSVSESDAFARALGVTRQDHTRRVAPATVDLRPVAQSSGAVATVTSFASRLDGMSPEERFSDVRQRIDALSADVADESKDPPDVFGRWLSLLKEINVQHGRGEIPTPVFYKFNTELLEMISAPGEAEGSE